eukprot:TRINITY_DN225_c0_g1_i23.p1 TRINITY_DN225_c0_g1~~TRINITY_DN225_c0_g1_i23.p1  ORF type:complete len:356 (-),score=96.35 TRINITY_DN225_c0_g1_i23:23-1090(-)
MCIRDSSKADLVSYGLADIPAGKIVRNLPGAPVVPGAGDTTQGPKEEDYLSKDPALCAFATAVGAQVDDKAETLWFPTGMISMYNHLFQEHKKLFIRPEYKEIFEQIRFFVTKEGFYLIGNPGTGKSTSRCYFCHRFLAYGREINKATYVLFIRASSDAPIYVVRQRLASSDCDMLVFTKNRTWELTTLIEEWEKSGALVVSLIDVSQGETTSAVTTVHRIYFTSPHKDILRNHTRTQNPGGAYDVYIDLWQEETLVNLAVDVYNVSLDSVKTRIQTYGLDARVACCKRPEHDPQSAVYKASNRLNNALNDTSFHEALLKYLSDGNHHSLPLDICLLYTSPSPRDRTRSRMPSSA